VGVGDGEVADRLHAVKDTVGIEDQRRVQVDRMPPSGRVGQ